MRFKQATANNVAENRVKLSPKLQEELKQQEAEEEKKEKEVPIANTAKPADKEAAGKKRLEKFKASVEAEALISVNLRLEPHLNAEILCVLYPGIKVRVCDSEDPEWYALTYQGRDVFVKKEYLKII